MTDVKSIAKLAHLTLTNQELKLYSKQFKAILGYIDQLSKVDTKGIKPTFQTIDNTTNIWRNDKVRPCLTQKQALSSASKTHQGYFVADHVFSPTNLPSSSFPRRRESIKSKEKQDEYGAILTKVDSKGTVGHKDLFCTKGIETTAGSKVLLGYIPQYSATLVKQLENLGLKTKHKLNQDAWGHGSSGENSDFFPTQNPWDKKRVAGGSSSGSAATVATGEVELATGTDTCGSIRMPSAYCNVTGLKPTYGAISRYGLIAFASSLDCPGLITTSAKKLKKIYKSVAVPDPLDATSQSPSRNKTKTKPIKTIGVPKEFLLKGLDPKIKTLTLKAADQFKKAGYKIKEVSLPHAHLAIATYYIIAPVEASSNLARYDGVRYGYPRNHFGPEAKRRIMLGTFASSVGYADKYYEKAAKVRTLIINDFKKAFGSVDAILAPISPTPAFLLGEKVDDPLKLYLMDIYTAPASLAGLPAVSVPCGFSNKLPVGMQLIGPRWNDLELLNLAEKYQQLTNWHKQKPNI
ncbi:Asp-tRNA(Asn)/Glu-tRNA(Gln) amidotransferase subunit GatC [Patescibacteria group bacterium]|nr:Asp-tRNA(Asn)/Glu-tRNA(Gln) amidotransferase subunit GatC [Patescibacteria group bacterium]